MANMNDIARATGLNISTISRALSGNHKISTQTRELVEKAAADLGYSSLQMRRGKRRPIALIVPELHSQYYVDMIHILKSKLKEKGHTTIFTISGYSPQGVYDTLKEMKKLEVSGICLVIAAIGDLEKEFPAISSLLSGIPVVIFADESHFIPADTIFVDQGYMIDLIVRHLNTQGYKDIAYIGEPLSKVRLQKLKISCKQNNITLNDDMIFVSEKRFEEGGYLMAKELLKSAKLPEAVVASYDELAIGALRAFAEAKIDVPKDIALVGIDDLRIDSYLSPQLTSINTPIEQMCISTVDLLLNQIENSNEHVVQHISLQAKLIIRESTPPREKKTL